MSKSLKKIRDNNDKKVLKETFGTEPKHRCPVCHRFTLFFPKRNGEAGCECAMCEMMKITQEETTNETE